jgi:hypothetical protein
MWGFLGLIVWSLILLYFGGRVGYQMCLNKIEIDKKREAKNLAGRPYGNRVMGFPNINKFNQPDWYWKGVQEQLNKMRNDGKDND